MIREEENKQEAASLDSLCAALAYAVGIEPPACSAPKNEALAAYVDEALGGEKADRLILYNPDAIAAWISEKYADFLAPVTECTEKAIPLQAVMPSVTPVCFGTMYTGAQPQVHGIQKYEKPVITIDTLFDRLVAAGKRVALVTYGKCSLSRIFLERKIDYFHFETGGIAAVNAKAVELLLRDEHDVIVIYNGNYDSVMHKCGPESAKALAELRVNAHVFAVLARLVETHLQGHNTLLGFAMDHGCHEIDGESGSHGLDMSEDIDICHFYRCYKRKEQGGA
ncbi:MAG: hypothetical protein IKD31_02565 [Clostridia bacterium]|nr:hypothetical protein [Clostridia bacterium]